MGTGRYSSRAPVSAGLISSCCPPCERTLATSLWVRCVYLTMVVSSRMGHTSWEDSDRRGSGRAEPIAPLGQWQTGIHSGLCAGLYYASHRRCWPSSLGIFRWLGGAAKAVRRRSDQLACQFNGAIPTAADAVCANHLRNDTNRRDTSCNCEVRVPLARLQELETTRVRFCPCCWALRVPICSCTDRLCSRPLASPLISSCRRTHT